MKCNHKIYISLCGTEKANNRYQLKKVVLLTMLFNGVIKEEGKMKRCMIWLLVLFVYFLMAVSGCDENKENGCSSDEIDCVEGCVDIQKALMARYAGCGNPEEPMTDSEIEAVCREDLCAYCDVKCMPKNLVDACLSDTPMWPCNWEESGIDPYAEACDTIEDTVWDGCN